MNKNISVIIFLFSCFFIYSQEDTAVVYLNNEGMTLDSFVLIVNDSQISYKKKMDIFYKCNYKRNRQQDKQISIINKLLSESKRRRDVNGILYSYVYLADLYYEWDNNELFNAYIDSADMYVENAIHPLALAQYHYTNGTQAINMPYGKKEGYKQFEKAIDYYEQLSRDTYIISYYIYNIAVYTANQPDTIFAKRLIRKIENILQKDNPPFIDFTLNTMKSDLYSMYFEATRQ